jgi:hypothetical protein
MVDHYHFRAVMQSATKANPLLLQTGGAAKPWWQSYYDPANLKYHERMLFIR